MAAAFPFLLIRSWKNRFLARFRRLHRPKYLVSLLAGLAYLYFIFLEGPFFRGRRISVTALEPDPGKLIILETVLACMLLGVVLAQWFFVNTRNRLFDDAEVQFLFPAPFSRAALLNYRIAKGQIGILFGTLITAILFGRLFSNRIFALIAIWLVYLFLYLYKIAALMTNQGLERQGAGGRKRKYIMVSIFLLAVVAAALWGNLVYPRPPVGSAVTAENVFAWLKHVLESGPISYVIFPFRLLVRPALAASIPAFLISLVPVVLMTAALYIWIRCSRAGFEEAVLGAYGSDTAPSGAPGKQMRKRRRSPFRLSPAGFVPFAIYWKNLSLAGGFSLSELLPTLAGLSIFVIVVLRATGIAAPALIGSMAVGICGFLTLMGPILFRDDLRTDLRNVELLKSYPVPGWGIVLGEVLGPATVLAILQWVLVLLAAGLLPGTETRSLTAADRVYVAIGAALLLPCFGFIGILVQNAAVLLLPGWIHLGREHQRGVEAMGQRLITGIATAVSLLIAAVPASLLFMAMWAAGYWLIGLAIVPLASMLAALGLLAEAAFGVLWLGRRFDRFDASLELT